MLTIAVALVAGCLPAAGHGPSGTPTPRPTVNATAHPTAAPTSAAPHPEPRHTPPGPYTGPVTQMPGISISYSGGPVQHHPRIHLIFWGGAWESSGADLIAAQDRLFASLDGSPWTAILQQYRDRHGAAAQDVTLVGTWIDRAAPPSVLPGDLLSAEVIRAAAANRWSLGPDDQFILYLKAHIDIGAINSNCAYMEWGATEHGPLALRLRSGGVPGCAARGSRPRRGCRCPRRPRVRGDHGRPDTAELGSLR